VTQAAGDWDRWRWLKVLTVHGDPTVRPCPGGDVHSYVYRIHPEGSSSFERCIGLRWCSDCRAYEAATVQVPASEALVDALDDLAVPDRERAYRSEARLLDALDRRVRQPAPRSLGRFRSVLAAGGGPYTCPCCGHPTLPERGVFEICAECGWEDDGQDDHDADGVRGGPNGPLSLTEARQAYLQVGGQPLLHHPPTAPK